MTVTIETQYITTDGKAFHHKMTAYQHEFVYQAHVFSTPQNESNEKPCR